MDTVTKEVIIEVTEADYLAIEQDTSDYVFAIEIAFARACSNIGLNFEASTKEEQLDLIEPYGGTSRRVWSTVLTDEMLSLLENKIPFKASLTIFSWATATYEFCETMDEICEKKNHIIE